MEKDVEKKQVDELQKQLVEMSANLKEAIRRAENAENMEAATAQDSVSLKIQMQNNLEKYEEGKKRDHDRWVEALKELEEVKEKLETAEANGKPSKDEGNKRVDELQKQLAEMSAKVEEANRRAENAENMEAATAQDRDSLKLDMQNNLKEYNKRKKRDKKKYVEVLKELELVKATAEENETAMSQKLRESDEGNKNKQERIDELERKFAENEAPQQLHQRQLQRHAAAQQQIQPSQLHPDIFQMFEEETNETMSMMIAVNSLRHMMFSDKQWRSEYEKAMDGEDVSLNCEMCEKTFTKHEIIDHFLSLEHVKKIREARTYFVSRCAVEYWKRKLHAVPKPIAVAARTANSGSEDE